MEDRNFDKDRKTILGYLPKYIELCHVRVSSNVLNFTVYGIFAGLLLSGFVTDVPVLALGIGLAVGSFLSVLLLLYYGQKESEAKLDLDEILARVESVTCYKNDVGDSVCGAHGNRLTAVTKNVDCPLCYQMLDSDPHVGQLVIARDG